MEEENNDFVDDEGNQRVTPDWTKSNTEREDEEMNADRDVHVPEKNDQELDNKNPYETQDTMSTALTPKQDHICVLPSTLKSTNFEAQQHAALQEKTRDLKGKDIVAKVGAITCNVINDDVVDVVTNREANVPLCENELASTPRWPILEKELSSKKPEKQVQAEEQHTSQTPNWFAPSSSSRNVDKRPTLKIMDDLEICELMPTPKWPLAREKLSHEEQAQYEEQKRREEELQAQEQYTSETPTWPVSPVATDRYASSNTNMYACGDETTIGVEEESTCRAKKMEGAPATTTTTTTTKVAREQQGNQTHMYPLPEEARILELPIYNTYHHHHVHELRKGKVDRRYGESTSTDASYHTHTSQHKAMKVETRMFTFNCESSVVEYFKEKKVNIRVTSTQAATYTTVVVKRDLLEFVHHIVHRHAVHVANSTYPHFFNLTSVCSQTCTRTSSQCRLFGPLGHFFHSHFHEFIHTIFVSAPLREDAIVFGQYLHLGTIYKPNPKIAEPGAHPEQEISADHPSTSAT